MNAPPAAHAAFPVGGKLLGVEAVRGIAALLVVLFHAGVLLSGPKDYTRLPLGGAFGFGRAGVDVFFVLSGFIISYIHASDIGRPRRLLSFARKRLVRIYPSYWIATLLLLAIMLASPTPDRREHDAGFVLSSLALLPARAEPLLGPGWSLRHELLFYALFATSLLHRRLGAAVLGTWFAGIAANTAFVMAYGAPAALWSSWLLAPINIEFLFGMAVTAIARRAGRAPPPAPTLAVGCALFAATALLETAWAAWPPLHWGYAAASLAILLGLVLQERRKPLRVPHALVRLGEASYALYLLHVIVIMLAVYGLRRAHAWVPLPLAFAAVVAASVGAALLFTWQVEQPLLRALRPRRRLGVAK